MYTALEKLKFRESFMKVHFPMDNFSNFCESVSKFKSYTISSENPLCILISRYDRSRNLSYFFFHYIKNYNIV